MTLPKFNDLRNERWKCLLATAAVILFFCGNGNSRPAEISLAELVDRSDVIAIGKVESQKILPSGETPRTKTVVVLEKVLKGRGADSKPLEFITAGTREMQLPDQPSFPPPGSRALLFLTSNEDGIWNLAAGELAVWPIEAGTDKTLGFGFNYSIELVEREIANRQNAFDP